MSCPSKDREETRQLMTQAAFAYSTESWEDAEKYYLALTRIEPQIAKYWFRLGNIYVNTSRPDHAIKAYEQAIVVAPDHGKARHNLGMVHLRLGIYQLVHARTFLGEDSQQQTLSQLLQDLIAELDNDSALSDQ